MDFSPDEGQRAVTDVVTSALGRENSWDALVNGGVVAFGVPERLGGDGLGLPEITSALTEIGRFGNTSPAFATLGLAAILPALTSPQPATATTVEISDGEVGNAVAVADVGSAGAELAELLAKFSPGARITVHAPA